MVPRQTQTEPEESIEAIDPGKKRYGRLVRMFREGYLAIHIYKNVHENRTFYDIVILRKIKKDGKQEYVRGANLKPSDLPALEVLTKAARDFIESVSPEDELTR